MSDSEEKDPPEEQVKKETPEAPKEGEEAKKETAEAPKEGEEASKKPPKIKPEDVKPPEPKFDRGALNAERKKIEKELVLYSQITVLKLEKEIPKLEEELNLAIASLSIPVQNLTPLQHKMHFKKYTKSLLDLAMKFKQALKAATAPTEPPAAAPAKPEGKEPATNEAPAKEAEAKVDSPPESAGKEAAEEKKPPPKEE